jgi:hypothetical protein
MSYVGERVIIPEGTVYNTTTPPGTRTAKRITRVKIVSEVTGKDPCVQWQGKSTSWCWVHPSAVRRMDHRGYPEGIPEFVGLGK